MYKKLFIIGIITATILVYFTLSDTTRAATSLSDCGIITQSNETFILTRDISSADTCLTVTANNVVIDLNGFTITYGSGGVTQMYGVRSGWGYGNIRVTNGTIRQSQAAGSFSHAVYFSSGSNDEVDHLTLEVYTDSSAAIQTWWGTGHHVHDNTITSHVETIQDRHQNQGYDIQLWEGASFDVHDNTIVGGPQGGIFYYHSDNTKVYNNDISQGGQAVGYSNDFCIGASGGNSEVYNNNCHPIQGRGIHLSGNGSKAYGNTINVIEPANNAEYGGCQAGGTYGIQIEYPATNLEVYNNTVIARADACAAQGFRATQISEGNNCRVYNNTFTAIRVGTGVGAANALSFADVTGGLIIQANTLSADTANFYVDWDGASNVLLDGNTLVKGSNPSTYYTISFGNGGTHPSLGNIIRDSIYQNGADDSSYRVRPAAYEYLVQWSLQLNAKSANGATIPSVNVGIYDQVGATAYSGVTDSDGKLSVPLTEYRRYNQSGTNYLQQLAAHSITVTKTSYEPKTLSVTADQSKTTEIVLSGSTADSVPPAGVTNLLAQ